MAPKKAKPTRAPPVEEDDPNVIAAVRDLQSRASILGMGTAYLRDHSQRKEMTRRVPVIAPSVDSSIQPVLPARSWPIEASALSSSQFRSSYQGLSDLPLDLTPFIMFRKQLKPGEALITPSGDQNPNLMGVLALPYKQHRPHSGPPASSVRAGTLTAATQPPPSGGERAPTSAPVPSRHPSSPQASSSCMDHTPHHADNVPPAAAAPVSRSPQNIHQMTSPQPQASSHSFAAASTQLQQPPALLPPFQVQRTLSAPQSHSFPVSPGSSPPHPAGPAHLQEWVNWTLRAAALCQAIAELEKKL